MLHFFVSLMNMNVSQLNRAIYNPYSYFGCKRFEFKV